MEQARSWKRKTNSYGAERSTTQDVVVVSLLCAIIAQWKKQIGGEIMAAETYVIYVPDRSAPITGFLRSMTIEEVRSALVGAGHSALENAEVVSSADGRTLTFRRVTGGTKGL